MTTSLDYDISPEDQIRGRYIYNSAVGIDNSATLPAFFLPQPNKFHLVTINEYHTFSPTLTNELRIGFNRFHAELRRRQFHLSGTRQFSRISAQRSEPPEDRTRRQRSTERDPEYLSGDGSHYLDQGRAHLKFGVEGRKIIAPQTFTQRVRGDYEYNNTLQLPSGRRARFVRGTQQRRPIYYGDQAALYTTSTTTGASGSNLTLNLGFRYEYTTIPYSQALAEPEPGRQRTGPDRFRLAEGSDE